MNKEELEIIETKQYLRKLSELLHKGQKEAELRQGIKKVIRKDPLIGDLIPGSGGMRKLRYAAAGKGKSGGYRIIYYFYDEENPAFLMTIYSKTEADNLTQKSVQKLYEFSQQFKLRFKNMR